MIATFEQISHNAEQSSPALDTPFLQAVSCMSGELDTGGGAQTTTSHGLISKVYLK